MLIFHRILFILFLFKFLCKKNKLLKNDSTHENLEFVYFYLCLRIRNPTAHAPEV